ncbi:MAG: hypothetical protein ACPL5F_11585 [Moorellaceae bacterium]
MWRNIRFLATTALLWALTVTAQMVGLPHPVTGPLVNAMLVLLATLTVGIASQAGAGLPGPSIAHSPGGRGYSDPCA